MSELLVNTIKKADGTGSLTVPAESGTVVTTASPSLGRRNLIINGAMQVAQRGTSTSMAHDGTREGYAADRFSLIIGGNADQLDGTLSQDTDAPDGYSNSLKWTTGTAETTVDADDIVYLQQKIEAQNVQHLQYGTSGAKQVTVSFWVKSSQTGTFGISLFQADGTRNIGSTYTISTANTWEQKTLTFAGDTGGTINNDNGEGLRVIWHLASGSDFDSADNTSWGAYTATRWAYGHAQDGVVTTASATFQITGVQLEVGSVATPFEHRSYGEELALCQRYFQRSVDNDTGDNLSTGATQAGTTAVRFVWPLSVPLRASPTVSQTGTGWKMFAYNTSNGSTNTPTVYRHTVDAAYIGLQVNNYSGLSDNRVCSTSPQNLTKLDFDSEL